MKIEGEMSGVCALIKFKKNCIVAWVPLDDSIQATGTPYMQFSKYLIVIIA